MFGAGSQGRQMAHGWKRDSQALAHPLNTSAPEIFGGVRSEEAGSFLHKASWELAALVPVLPRKTTGASS